MALADKFLAVVIVGAMLLPVAGVSAPLDMTLGYQNGANTHPHNLSDLRVGGGVHAASGEESQICVFCHTPHGASPSATPLWNRRDPVGPNGDGSFPLYGNADPNSVRIKGIAEANYKNDGSVEYPNGSSRMCLSCHDGVSAVGEVISGQTLANLTMSAGGTIDLDTSHPISFVYTQTVADAINAANGGSTAFQLPPAGYVDSLSRMQCTSCHDPHVDTQKGAYGLPMWKHYTGVDNEDADYATTCNACHGGSFRSSFAPVPGDGHNNQ